MRLQERPGRLLAGSLQFRYPRDRWARLMEV